MQHHYTFAAIDDAAPDDYTASYREDPGYKPGDWSRDMMGNLADWPRNMMKGFGFWCDDDNVHYDDAAANVLDHMFALIDEAYDCQAEPPEGTATPWALMGLSGDDDVDYNSGYPTSVLDTVRDMIKAA